MEGTCATSRLMVASQQHNAAWFAKLEGQDDDENLNAPRPAIDAIAREAKDVVVCGPAGHGKCLYQ